MNVRAPGARGADGCDRRRPPMPTSRLKQAQAGLPEADARFLAALVYGTLERLLYLDHVLAAYAPGRAKKAGARHFAAGRVRAACSCARRRTLRYRNMCRCAGRSARAARRGLSTPCCARVDRERGTPPPLPAALDERLSIRYSHPLWAGAHVARGAGPGGDGAPARLPAAAAVRARAVPGDGRGPARLAPLPRRTRADGRKTACALRAGWTWTASEAFAAGRMTVQGEGAMLALPGAGATAAG